MENKRSKAIEIRNLKILFFIILDIALLLTLANFGGFPGFVIWLVLNAWKSEGLYRKVRVMNKEA